MAGWWVNRRSSGKAGSCYLSLEHVGGAELTVRVSDHVSRWADRQPGRYDVRTQPHDLLRAIRFLRHYRPAVEPAMPDPERIAWEREQAEAMVRDARAGKLHRCPARPGVTPTPQDRGLSRGHSDPIPTHQGGTR